MTPIEWTDETWNPATGCTQVSPGCDRCYAMVLHNRRHAIFQENEGHWPTTGLPMPSQYAVPFSQLQVFVDRLDKPLHWHQPKKIFVNSMSDLFHRDIPPEFILDVFSVMMQANWHIYQVLTKRPSRVALMVPAILERIGGRWPGHIWIGTSVERDDYRWRVDKLRQVPAPIRFISAEPLLGPIHFDDLAGISWVIAGAESGDGARPMSDDWVRLIRDQCKTSGTAFFFKQRATAKGKKLSRPMLDGQHWEEFPSMEKYYHYRYKVQEFGEIIESVVAYGSTQDEATITNFIRKDIQETFPDGTILSLELTAITDASGRRL